MGLLYLGASAFMLWLMVVWYLKDVQVKIFEFFLTVIIINTASSLLFLVADNILMVVIALLINYGLLYWVLDWRFGISEKKPRIYMLSAHFVVMLSLVLILQMFVKVMAG